MNCKTCNTESDSELCSPKCVEVMNKANKRVLIQRSLFDKVLNKVKEGTCNDCGGKRKKYSQYCEPCKTKRRRKISQDYEFKVRGQRLCKNEDCRKPMLNPNSNSHKYCSDECKPKRVYSEKSKLKRVAIKNKDKVKMGQDRYEGTIDSKWIQPRGSKMRAEQGLEVTTFGMVKDSDVGGRFVY